MGRGEVGGTEPVFSDGALECGSSVKGKPQ